MHVRAVWDSGRVESASRRTSPTPGAPLAAGGRYRWKVRCLGRARAGVRLERPGPFEVELDRTSGWHASWISPEPRPGERHPALRGRPGRPGGPCADPGALPAPGLHRGPAGGVGPAVRDRARPVRGAAERPAGRRRLPRARLDRLRASASPYQTYDVTGAARRGRERPRRDRRRRVVRRLLGFDAKRAGAHYGTAPELLAQLVLRLGRRQRAADRHRRAVAGPAGAIRHADLLMGERHDLALEPPAGTRPASTPVTGGRSGAGTATATAAGRRSGAADPGDRGDRAAQHRHRRPRPAHRRLRPEPDRLAADQRRRAARDARPGPARRGARGRRQPVHREPAHRPADRRVHAPGGGTEVLEPRFTLHGFRYAEITGYPGDIDQADITARVVHSDTPAAGSF